MADALSPHEHERAWAEALDQEHAHQRELLAVLRDELGTFAKECAAALTALEGLVAVGGIAGVLANARDADENAGKVLELGRRVKGHARPRKAGDGPATEAAVGAVQPLAAWEPDLAEEPDEPAESELTRVLEVAASLGAGVAVTAAAEVSALTASLRETADHVRGAIEAVREGKLEQVLAEARRKLEADLAALQAVHTGAHAAPEEWRRARRDEHAELTEEVRAKLDKVERLRRVLGALLPHLQVVSRALTAIEKVEAVESRLEPEPAAGVEAARLLLLLSLRRLWAEVVSAEGAVVQAARRSSRTPWLAGAGALVVAAVVLAVVLSTGSSKHAAATTTTTTTSTTTTTTTTATEPTTTTTTTTTTPTTTVPPVPPEPKLSPVHALFDEARRETVYTVTATARSQGPPAYSWRLKPPKGNPGCNKFAPVPGKPNEAIWHHADTDGCLHVGFQHAGWVYATVTTSDWVCTQSFFGTLSRTGRSAERCHRRT